MIINSIFLKYLLKIYKIFTYVDYIAACGVKYAPGYFFPLPVPGCPELWYNRSVALAT